MTINGVDSDFCKAIVWSIGTRDWALRKPDVYSYQPMTGWFAHHFETRQRFMQGVQLLNFCWLSNSRSSLAARQAGVGNQGMAHVALQGMNTKDPTSCRPILGVSIELRAHFGAAQKGFKFRCCNSAGPGRLQWNVQDRAGW